MMEMSDVQYRAKDACTLLVETKNVQIVMDRNQCDESVSCLEIETEGKPVVVGMDCEWVSEGSKPGKVALLQLSSLQHCVLVRLCCLQDGIPESLRGFLESRRIIKVGVAVCDDTKRLMSDYGIVTKGCIDLRNVVISSATNTDQCTTLIKGGGLRSLADSLLHINLDKSPRVRRSDWEAEKLSNEQVLYAANDAYVSLKIFEELVKQKTAQQSGVASIWEAAMTQYGDIVDVPYKASWQKQTIHQQEPGSILQPFESSRSVVRKTNAMQARQKPLYDNCHLLAPNGDLLCTCDEKKIRWYVTRGLGEIVSENPLRLKLKFEPSGRPDESQQYYMIEKHNVCVVCGKGESYLRKNVIPHEYRQHFPVKMKDHICYDILLLCTGCHQASDFHDSLVRKKLAVQYSAPLSVAKQTQDRQLSKVRMAANALTRHKEKIPMPRREELEQIVKDHYQTVSVNDDILRQASSVDTKIPNTEFVPHGQTVVEAVSRDRKLQDFERMWRQHFLDAMKPRFLPQLWSVTHNQPN